MLDNVTPLYTPCSLYQITSYHTQTLANFVVLIPAICFFVSFILNLIAFTTMVTRETGRKITKANESRNKGIPAASSFRPVNRSSGSDVSEGRNERLNDEYSMSSITVTLLKPIQCASREVRGKELLQRLHPHTENQDCSYTSGGSAIPPGRLEPTEASANNWGDPR